MDDRWTRVLLSLAIAVLVGSMVTAGLSAPRTEHFLGGDFYTPPGQLVAGPHGTLVRYERAAISSLPDSTTWRVMYRSNSIDGAPIAVTGLVIVPTTPAPPGGRPVVTVGHGTAGIADRCAPSKTPDEGDALLLGDAVRRGWLVVITDYEGLGTPGRHPYLVGESEGRAMLDIVRASRPVPDARPGRAVGIAGYSQGGHSALWARQIAARWTPELTVVGTYAGASVSGLSRYIATPPTGLSAGFPHLLVAGLGAAHPEADPVTYLTPEGARSLGIVDRACGISVLGFYKDSDPDALISISGRTAPPWPGLAEVNTPGRAAAGRAPGPILLLHAAADELVPLADSDDLLARLCAAGQVTDRHVLDGAPGAPLGHGQAQAPSYALGLAWLADRFAGLPGATNTCP